MKLNKFNKCSRDYQDEMVDQVFEIILRKMSYMHSIQHDVHEQFDLLRIMSHQLNVIDPKATVMKSEDST